MKTVMSELQRMARELDKTNPYGCEFGDRDGLCRQELETFIYDHMPHGSGFDSGVSLVSLTPDKAVFFAPFHHMNEHGMYDGWVTYIVTIRSTFNGPDVTVSVKGYDNTARKYADDLHRMYIAETFYYDLFDKDIGE